MCGHAPANSESGEGEEWEEQEQEQEQEQEHEYAREQHEEVKKTEIFQQIAAATIAAGRAKWYWMRRSFRRKSRG